MITNVPYKLIAGQIAKIFCSTDTICAASTKERIITNFNNETFAIFLQNIQYGRFLILRYSNWRAKTHCRNMVINVTLTDAITGEIKTGFWEYDNDNCQEKQYYYPNLNTLISRNGYQLIDPPIKDKTIYEITKPRLIYNKNAKSYGITYTPPEPGGGGGGVVIKPPVTPPVNQPSEPTQTPNNFDVKSLLENPIILIGGAIVLYMLIKDKI